ncbi:MAG: hypothetical protein IPL40_06205 [Proteobacteria bacterium]|nr:hypothetical protein [Pseudomonadota bacterium]
MSRLRRPRHPQAPSALLRHRAGARRVGALAPWRCAVVGLCLLPLAACAAHSERGSSWRDTTVDYGQGQLRLSVRVRWSVESDPAGATIRTPEGGEALVRVFACGQPMRQVRAHIAERLRGQMLAERLVERGGVLAWAWRPGRPTERAATELPPTQVAVAVHGPLLIAVSSTNLPPDEVVELARRVRLELPIPLIRGCLPVCGPEQPCQPEEGTLPL